MSVCLADPSAGAAKLSERLQKFTREYERSVVTSLQRRVELKLAPAQATAEPVLRARHRHLAENAEPAHRPVVVANTFNRAPAIATNELTARVTGLVYLVGTVLGAALLTLSTTKAEHSTLVIVVAGVTTLVGIALLGFGHKLPSGILEWANPAGAVAITLEIAAFGPGIASNTLFWLYLLPVVSMFFLFGWRPAFIGLGIVYACALASSLLDKIPLGQTFFFYALAIVIAAVIGWLVRAAEHVEVDPVTGLLNRTGFTRRVEAACEEAARRDNGFSIICITIDGFSDYVTRHGAQQAEKLVQYLVERWRTVLPPKAIMARLGLELDVFAVKLDDDDNRDQIVQDLISVHDGQSFSVGIEVWQPNISASELVTLALSAMHSAVHKGGGTISDLGANRRQVAALRKGLVSGEMHLVFQPIVDLRSGEAIGAEALLRWTLPSGESIPPDIFIPIAEDSGDIIEIGRWVLQEACERAAQWTGTRESWRKVTVNVAAAQLIEPDFVEHLSETLHQTGLSPDRLVLEVTERTLESQPDVLVETLANVQRLGVKVAIDDFGTGYSTLSRIWKLPIDSIKIDKTFINAIVEDDRAYSIVATIVTIGGALELSVIAEGVETAAQMAKLNDLGCGEAQGYLFGRPAADTVPLSTGTTGAAFTA